jgi:Predicted nucleotide-binding protein containing TIR -like domain
MENKLTQLINKAESIKSSTSKSDSPDFTAWKDDVIRFLKRKYGDDSHEAKTFSEIEYYNFYGCTDAIKGKWVTNTVKELKYFQKGMETAILYLKNYLDDFVEIEEKKEEKMTKKNENKYVFIVHGKNDGIKAQVSNLILKLGLKPIVLHEQANQGKTIIEKFEKHSDVSAAIILFTDDDLGKYKDDPDLEVRARQNAIFEAGYFIGKLGRENTIILVSSNINIPSDLQGYVYIELDLKQRWHLDVAKELKAIGFDIDMNRLCD